MWTLGTLIAAPLFTIIGMALLAYAVWMWRSRADRPASTFSNGTHYKLDHGEATVFSLIGIALALIILLAVVLGMFPYKAEYHRWETKDGVVSRIDKRLVGSGDGMEEKFVVTFDGTGQQYGCLDTRCASIHEGDYLELACKKVFEYGATDGWDCKFRSWEDRTP